MGQTPRNHRVVATIDAAGYANRAEYDRDGRVVAEFDTDGNRKTIGYDARSKVTSVSVPHTPTNAATRQRVTRCFYDENGNQTKVEHPRGVATTTAAEDFLDEVVYDANNRVVQRKSPFATADPTYKTPANTFFAYDAVGNLSRQSEPTAATTAAAARDWSSFTWFDNGAARTSTDPWGITTSYGLNLLGQQTSRTLTSAAGDATRSMSWDYWPDGSLKSRSDTAPPAGVDEVMVDNSDLQNVAVTGTWATGSSAATKVGYDYQTHAGAAGSTDSFSWKLRVPTSGTYSVYARCPAGAATATAATYTVQHSTGSATATVNQAACTAQSPWVALGNYTFAEGVDKKVTLAVPGSGTVVADAVKLVKAGTGEGAKKTFSYDYDVNGQQTAIHDTSADARTDTFDIRYDGLGRPDQIRELKAGVAQATTTYGYDANSNLTSWFADDQAAPEVDQFAAYTYDVRDMLAKIEAAKNPADTAKKTTTYTYTSRGERAGIVKPNGNTVAYRWIEDGLMRSQVEKTADGKLVASHSLGYDLDGNRTSDVSKVKNADSASAYLEQTASLAYTPDGRLRWVTKSGANPGSAESYAYDPAGNVRAQTIAGVPTSYTFDRNRMLRATTAGTAADYNYDPFGRLDTITTGDKTVERYGYDGFDRTVSHRKYDPATGAEKSRKATTFDPLDRTVQETTTVAGTTKTKVLSYLGLTDQVVSEETPGTGGETATVSASYTYGPSGERISQTKNPGAGTEETAYYGLNPHTDVETLTDQSGNPTSTYRYTAYGNNDTAGFTGKDKATATAGPEVEPYNPYRFNSKRWDPATAGYDMGFRDYSPGLNRFLTRDMYNGALADIRLGTDPWNTNRYAFAGGNPITGIELDGHCAMSDEGGCDTNANYTGPIQPQSATATETTEPSNGQRVVRWLHEKPLGERAAEELVVKPVTETYEACKAAIQGENYQANWQSCKTGAALTTLGFTGGGKVFGIGVRSLQGMAAAEAEAAGASLLTGRAAGSAAKTATNVLPAFPKALSGGPANTHVYYGMVNGKPAYAGITNDLARRQAQHGSNYVLDPLTTSPVTRGQARAIEQALIVRNPGFNNKINSISPTHSYYDDAVSWGEAWLTRNGF